MKFSRFFLRTSLHTRRVYVNPRDFKSKSSVSASLRQPSISVSLGNLLISGFLQPNYAGHFDGDQAKPTESLPTKCREADFFKTYPENSHPVSPSPFALEDQDYFANPFPESTSSSHLNFYSSQVPLAEENSSSSSFTSFAETCASGPTPIEPSLGLQQDARGEGGPSGFNFSDTGQRLPTLGPVLEEFTATPTDPLSCQNHPKQVSGKSGSQFIEPGRNQGRDDPAPKADVQKTAAASTGHFSCPECPKLFCRKNELRKHVRTHSRDFPCLDSTCHRKFYRARDVQRHMAARHGTKEYKNRYFCEFRDCEYATRGFSRNDNLKRHVRQQHRKRAGLECKQEDF